MVKLSEEFSDVDCAVDFMNSLQDPLCSYIVPKVESYNGEVICTYFVVYYEHEQ